VKFLKAKLGALEEQTERNHAGKPEAAYNDSDAIKVALNYRGAAVVRGDAAAKEI